jgi:hypothetical protein
MPYGGGVARDGTAMSAETKQWLVEVVLVLLTVMALVCGPARSTDSARPSEMTQSIATTQR